MEKLVQSNVLWADNGALSHTLGLWPISADELTHVCQKCLNQRNLLLHIATREGYHQHKQATSGVNVSPFWMSFLSVTRYLCHH